MSTPQRNTVDSSPVQNQDDRKILEQILGAVAKDRSRGRLELALAVILSLATLSSTWCGYQARSWGGVQSTKQTSADTAERQAAEDTIVGLQLRTQDGLVLLEYWRAVRQGDAPTRDLIFAHIRPQLRAAIQASLDAGVLTNPDLPGPLQRPEYNLPEERQASRRREEAGQLRNGAQVAGHAADGYVLLTLMFASVLFFGGIASTFTARRVRTGLACVALALFIVTLIMLIGLPTYKQ